MPRPEPPSMPFHIMGPADATRYITPPELHRQWQTCHAHAVTTCPGCNALWRYDQLAHPSIGYYPGVTERTDYEQWTAETNGTTPTIPTGARYAHVCPTCRTDVTDFVQLHVDLCDSIRAARAHAIITADA